MVQSVHFRKNFVIAGRNIHRRASEKPKLRWFVYLEEDLACGPLQYVGSTNSMTGRWAATKSNCNTGQSNGTGLEKHFKDGCPNDTGRDKMNIRITLLEHMDTTVDRLDAANHKPGACRCRECEKLKDLEDKWILRLGSLHGPCGLNTRDEIQAKARVQY